MSPIIESGIYLIRNVESKNVVWLASSNDNETLSAATDPFKSDSLVYILLYQFYLRYLSHQNETSGA
jgi:hypothetical protein